MTAFRAWSVKKGVLDVPNERSSHVSPTPRGGGVVIVGVVLVLYVCISYFYTSVFSYGYLGGAIVIALVSWLDDIYTISFVWRFCGHGLAAILLIIDKGYWSTIDIPGISAEIGLGVFGPITAFLWIVWLINAYNFMDGIDGIAGIQGAIAGLSWLVFGQMAGNNGIYFFGGVLFFASSAFLIHNWQPARVFMGDVGSAFLGFTFAAIPFLARPDAGGMAQLLPFAAILFVWFFLVDSIVTFARRAFRLEKVWIAHREHLYQRLVTSGLSHAFVTILYGLLASAMSAAVLFAAKFRNVYDIALIPVLILLTALLISFCISRRALT